MAFPTDAVFKVVTTFHRTVFDLSKGKLAGKASGMPVLKLTTIGRKSGQKRSTMLTSPLVEGDNVVLVASYGGDDRDPDWFGNLVANPDVDVVMNGSNRKMRARVAEGVERTRLVGGAHCGARQLRRLPAQDVASDPRGGARAQRLSDRRPGPLDEPR